MLPTATFDVITIVYFSVSWEDHIAFRVKKSMVKVTCGVYYLTNLKVISAQQIYYTLIYNHGDNLHVHYSWLEEDPHWFFYTYIVHDFQSWKKVSVFFRALNNFVYHTNKAPYNKSSLQSHIRWLWHLRSHFHTVSYLFRTLH